MCNVKSLHIPSDPKIYSNNLASRHRRKERCYLKNTDVMQNLKDAAVAILKDETVRELSVQERIAILTEFPTEARPFLRDFLVNESHLNAKQMIASAGTRTLNPKNF